MPYGICSRLNCTDLIFPPKFGKYVVQLLDGTNATIMGELDGVVTLHADKIVVWFKVVPTVIAALGADILLGIYYIVAMGRLFIDRR